MVVLGISFNVRSTSAKYDVQTAIGVELHVNSDGYTKRKVDMAKKYKTKRLYKDEILDEYDDNGTMVESKEELEKAVVGHKIVSVTEEPSSDRWRHPSVTVITLDNGHKVEMLGEGDCCAYTQVKAFLLNPELVDHVITGVGTTDGYKTWHIYADLGDVLKLDVEWSAGNPFYYGYGFHIKVKPLGDS